ncbi:flavin reductase family protein [Leucobacter luti]|uniref:flavin reductase family protein n=1 Tax=Leucobacter luti TaxID=340320 RepID=UPI003D069BA8
MNTQPTGAIGSAIEVKIQDLGSYRQVLGSFMTGVTVITTVDADGRQRGITANSFTSVSLDPPLVLFCVDYRAASYETFQSAEGFVIHVLSSEQQELAKTFASKSETKFAGLETESGHGGAPILSDVHGWLECRLHDTVIAGDHAIIIGEVLRYNSEPARPLGFYQGRFFGFNTDQEIAALAPQLSRIAVTWMMQTEDGAILARRTEAGGLVLPASSAAPKDVHARALAALAEQEFSSRVSVEFLYSVFEDEKDRLGLTYRGQVFARGAQLEQAGFVCLQPSEVDPEAFARPGESAIVGRYLDELANSRFGIYAGTLAEGAIAHVSGVQSDDRVPAGVTAPENATASNSVEGK